jgi:transcriptional regulator with XRE-family HTH domain
MRKEAYIMNQADTGKFIAKCRKEKGLTQAQLAEKLNITDRAISKWETGRSMPDSSIMLDLCQILGVSVNELLSGERIQMENINSKADETLLELKRKDENNINMNAVISIIFTITMIIGIMVCCICDLAITGSLTWSLITLSAILFAWIVSFPIILLGKKGVLGGMLSFSILLVPFLYILSILIQNVEIFHIGGFMSIFALVYLWIIYVLFLKLKNRKMLAAGITFIIAIPFMVLINITLSKLIHEPILDIWDIMSAFIILVIAFACLFRDYAHHKGLK